MGTRLYQSLTSSLKRNHRSNVVHLPKAPLCCARFATSKISSHFNVSHHHQHHRQPPMHSKLPSQPITTIITVPYRKWSPPHWTLTGRFPTFPTRTLGSSRKPMRFSDSDPPRGVPFTRLIAQLLVSLSLLLLLAGKIFLDQSVGSLRTVCMKPVLTKKHVQQFSTHHSKDIVWRHLLREFKNISMQTIVNWRFWKRFSQA